MVHQPHFQVHNMPYHEFGSVYLMLGLPNAYLCLAHVQQVQLQQVLHLDHLKML